jgi:type I restriction enzyme R subunit
MAKFDAMERQARDEPVSEEIERLLTGLVAEAMSTSDVLDIYEAAGLPRLSLDDLGTDFLEKAQAAPNAHLAIEALRKSLIDAGSRWRVIPERSSGRRSGP